MTTTLRTPAGTADLTLPGRRPSRSLRDLLVAQLAGIDRCAASTGAQPTGVMSREQRMDLERLRAARDREREAMRACTARALAESVHPLAQRGPARAVIAHRHPWFRDKVVAALQDLDVQVLAVVGDGADACGTVLAEQPEILLLEERLTSFSGLDVVRRAHAYAPGTFVGVQVVEPSSVGELMDAGAGSAFTRQVPPADVVVELTRCLVEQLP